MTGQWIPYLQGLCFLFLIAGLIGGLYLAPADYQQGDAFRIIYIHVPAAFCSLMVYGFMTFCALLLLIWRIKLAEVMLVASTSIGAWFTALALLTGAIWGKPMWGTWWIWDARLTSELILLFIYLAVLALSQALEKHETRGRLLAILVVVGSLDLPIIHFSVYWWNTLHQGATVRVFSQSAIDNSMIIPLFIMIAAFMAYFMLLVCLRARNDILLREKRASWVKDIITG